MPYCSKCGQRVKQNTQFCSQCGARLDAEEDNVEREFETTRPVKKANKVSRICAFCGGTGRDPSGIGIPPKWCPVCPDSSGHNFVPEDYVQCSDCGGTGKKRAYRGGIAGIGDVYKPCGHCQGTGWAPE
jgi:predicted nucleic acid-binding Zn ribbon protein